jgi:NAD(P)-dependent dehydrogenase (short-subunit alcohol dehydrogenase family)
MVSLSGRICLITGATSGIGKVTALELAKMGATVIVVGRNPEKTSTVVKAVQQVSGNSDIHMLIADLSIQAQVQQLAADFLQRYDHLDVLVNNAGAVFMTRQESADGIEMTWALNHLSYFLLTNLLLDALRRAPSARIVNVSSDAHKGGKFHFDDLELKHGFSGMDAYAQSKLANVMFTYSLARQLADTHVTTNAVHPGFVSTGFAANNGSLLKVGILLLRPFMASAEKGARTSIYLASSPEVEGISGQYFVNCKPKQTAPQSYDERAQRKLWQISEQMTGIDMAV